jgi:exonuclease III
MDTTLTRSINVLVWNIRGINSQAKWDALRDKIYETSPSIVCLQETKRESFNSSYLRKFCPRFLNLFEFAPSVGASGGLIIIWNGNLFSSTLVSSNSW